MALRDVTHFMRHDACEFALALSGNDGAGMDGNVAAGEREGVERVVPDGEEKEVVGARARLTHELIAETPEIIHDLRVCKVGGIRPHLSHQLRAETIFVLRREPCIGSGSERREIQVKRARGRGRNRNGCRNKACGNGNDGLQKSGHCDPVFNERVWVLISPRAAHFRLQSFFHWIQALWPGEASCLREKTLEKCRKIA